LNASGKRTARKRSHVLRRSLSRSHPHSRCGGGDGRVACRLCRLAALARTAAGQEFRSLVIAAPVAAAARPACPPKIPHVPWLAPTGPSGRAVESRATVLSAVRVDGCSDRQRRILRTEGINCWYSQRTMVSIFDFALPCSHADIMTSHSEISCVLSLGVSPQHTPRASCGSGGGGADAAEGPTRTAL
jgi:hypothetical protein